MHKLFLVFTLVLNLFLYSNVSAQSFAPTEIDFGRNSETTSTFAVGEVVPLDIVLAELDPALKSSKIEYGIAREIVDGEMISFEPIRNMALQALYSDDAAVSFDFEIPNVLEDDDSTTYVFYAKTYLENDPDKGNFVVSDYNFAIEGDSNENLIAITSLNFLQSNGMTFSILESPIIYNPENTEYEGVANSMSLELVIDSNFSTVLQPSLDFKKLRSDSEVEGFDQAEQITIEEGTNAVRIALPTFGYQSGVYQGKLSFNSSDLPDIEFEYVVAGNMVTFGEAQSSSNDESYVFDFDIYPAPIDVAVMGDESDATGQANTTYPTEFSFRNAEGEELHKVVADVDFSKPTYSISFPKDIKHVETVFIKTVDKDGAVLFESSKDLDVPYPQRSLVVTILMYLAVLCAVSGLLLYMKRKNINLSGTVCVVLGTGLVTASVWSIVYAADAYPKGWTLKRNSGYVIETKVEGVEYDDWGPYNDKLMAGVDVKFSEDVRDKVHPAAKDFKVMFRANAAISSSASYVKVGFSSKSLSDAKAAASRSTSINDTDGSSQRTDSRVEGYDLLLTSPYRQLNLGKLAPNTTNYMFMHREGRVHLTFSDSYKVPLNGVYEEEPNMPPTVTWQTPGVADKSATIKWKYADPENDKQTAFQVQYATNQKFSTGLKTVTGSGASVSQAITGLSSKTKYYARVRAKNAENTQWTAWASGSFTTTGLPPTEPPVTPPGGCETNCDGGGGGGGDGEDSFSCSVPGNPHSVGDLVTFEASSVNGATYQWYGPGNSVLSGQTSRTYQERVNSPTQLTRTVRATKDGDVFTASCTAAVGVTTGEDCDPATQICGGAPVEADFYFRPNIVKEGETCPLYLVAENALSCSLRNRTGSALEFSPVEGVISIVGGQSVSVGTYTLSCSGTDGNTKTYEPKACVTDFKIKED